jgi:hypothetical protein
MKSFLIASSLGLLFIACAPSAKPAQNLRWPVIGAVGQVWNVDIQKGGKWTLALTQKVEGAVDDGVLVPGGNTTGTDKRVGYFEYFKDDDYVVLWLDGSRDYFGCYIEKSGLQGQTLRGQGVKGVLYQDPVDLKAPCTVTLQSGNAAARGDAGSQVVPSAGSLHGANFN